MNEPWYTQAELAAKLKVSRRTIQRLRLPSMRVGGQNRYLMSQVQAALSERDGLPENVVALRPRVGERVA